MAQFETAFYLGAATETGYSGVEAETNFFIALSVEEGLTPEQGREFLKHLKDALVNTELVGLPDIENVVSRTIKEKNPPSGFSLSLGYLKENILYLKTIGGGEVIIRRNNQVAPLLRGNTSASGYFEIDDVFIFTTSHFLDILGGEEKLKTIFDHKSPHQIVDGLTPELKSHEDKGTVAIFVKFSPPQKDSVVEESETILQPRTFFDKTREDLHSYYLRFGKRRILTGVVVALIFLIFLWSVVLGHRRQTNAEATEKINLARDFISQKLSEAEEVAFLNMDSAVALLVESRGKLNEVKKVYPERSEIEELEKIISDAEGKILKKEEATSTEFFDLAVDNDKARGDKLYLEGDSLLILDKTNGNLYNLSLDKKSLAKNSASDLKKAGPIASYEGKQYFYVAGQGIYMFGTDGKVQRVVNQDKDWGVVKDLVAFNANLYLLDTGKDEIYKYVGAENGFGAKTSYFAAGQATDLSFVSSLAIDGSIYLGGRDTIIKFTSGLRDGFAMNLPEGTVNLTKVFTSKDLESVYGWDKARGLVYVMGKEGEFEKQVKSDSLTKAADVVVYNDGIYALVNGKIFLVE